VAILLGNLALVYSEQLMARAPLAARQVFDEVRLEVNIGQYLDVLGAARGPGGSGCGQEVDAHSRRQSADDQTSHQSADAQTSPQETVARAWTICRYKTAKYTVERPLHLGAALAPDRGVSLMDPLSAFGLPLGEAFQLRDDILGVFGDPSLTGKPVGDDLREGKLTLLVSLAWARATGAQARLLKARFGAPDLSPDEVRELAAIIEATGARREVEASIESLALTAGQALAALPIGAQARRTLQDLAAFATGRDY
jgi:geranylgeranyl diphosphate synthase type I